MTFLQGNSAQGLVIDFEEVPKDAHKDVLTFLHELKAAFMPHGWLLAIAAPFDDPEWTYRSYAAATDYQILMAYDEHFEEGQPGAIASQSWFVDKLSRRMKELDPAKTIIALGNYGYDWAEKPPAIDMTFQETVLTSKESDAPIVFDPQTLNPHFDYQEDDGSIHHVWFLDAVTAHNQLRAADVFRPRGYALWRLGSEDPSIWSLLGRPYNAEIPADLGTIVPGSDIDIEGQGEILNIAAEPANGARTFETDATHRVIVSETFTKIPSTYVIRRSGWVPGKVALTFDDGPSSEWTPKILDILKQKGVKATFFIAGTNGETNPSLVQRILAEGHEIGNHTFTHPNLGEVPHRGRPARDQRDPAARRGADRAVDAPLPAAVLRGRGTDHSERDRAGQTGSVARLRDSRAEGRPGRLARAVRGPDRAADPGPHGRHQPGNARPDRPAARCRR